MPIYFPCANHRPGIFCKKRPRWHAASKLSTENCLILNRPSIIWRAIAFVAVVCLSLVVLDGWRSWNARSVELGEMDVATSNLARAMAQQADDTFKEADTALLGIVERVEVDGTGPAALKRLHDNLVMRRQELPQLDGLFVFDENGNWIINSTSTLLNRFNTGPGPHIGVPVISRSSGKWVIRFKENQQTGWQFRRRCAGDPRY